MVSHPIVDAYMRSDVFGRVIFLSLFYPLFSELGSSYL